MRKGTSKLKIIQFKPPLMWSQAEYAKALLIKKTSFCHGKNGGDKDTIIKGMNHSEKDRGGFITKRLQKR